MKDCNKNVMDVIELAQKLLKIADKGDMDREDPGCGVIYGIVRESGYKIMRQAEIEIERHKLSGKWEEASNAV